MSASSQSQQTAILGARIFDGEIMRDAHAMLLSRGEIVGVVPFGETPDDATQIRLNGGTLAPGYVDLQVNGGGGALLNAAPTPETLQVIAEAHARLGATAILPTLITDRPEVTRAAIAATRKAIARHVPGIVGLHLEGPHLSLAHKGAHSGDLIRAMERRDLEELCAAAGQLPVLKLTVAPESVTLAQIETLTRAGAIVSLGHSDADYETCVRAHRAGATCVTHLFNAMSQQTARAPGLVGAALDLGGLSGGLIGDLIHVHPATIRAALRAKAGPGGIFLVSDSMAVAGTTQDHFELNGRRIERRGGRLTLADGTLAGADLDLSTAIANLTGIGVALEEALRMATSRPARVIGQGGMLGRLAPNGRADFVWLRDDLTLGGVWQGGVRLTS